MRALITGAGGFVGHYLIDHLLSSGDEVIATVLIDTLITPRAEKVKLDVLDLESCRKVLSHYRPDVIYHLAGIAFVPEAEENFQKALNVNVLGASNIFRTAHLLGMKSRILYISSAEVYGKIRPTDLPVTENVKVAPANNYSLSKTMGELVCERYGRQGIVTPVIMRPFNHIGPGQDERFVASSFAKQLAEIAKGKQEPVIYVGNLDARRDFSDVRDIVRAYRLAGISGSGVYNLSSGRSISIRSLLDLLIAASGLKVEIRQEGSRMRPAEVPEIYGSYAKAKSEFGWEPKIELRETLELLYKDWLERV